jgi:2-methylisocitrate lyase-like PEP mutase family enzyme
MKLRERLRGTGIIVAPGVYDALGALLAEQAGFEALYLSGASIAYTRLGRPDVGLVTASEVENAIANIADRVELPLIADADTGFGNALNVCRTGAPVRARGRKRDPAGRPGHAETLRAPGRKDARLRGEMQGKIRAALDARTSPDTLVIARTDAVAVEGSSPRSSARNATSRPEPTCCSSKRCARWTR